MEKEMKILIITPTFAPAWKFGGTVTAMLQMAKALHISKDVVVTVYTTNASGEENKLAVSTSSIGEFEGIKTWYFECGQFNNSAQYSKELIYNLKKTVTNFDIVYISAIWQFLGYKSAMICKDNNVPYIVGTHGSFSKDLRKKSFLKKNIYYYLFLKRMLKNSLAIHTTGKQEVLDSDGWIEHKNIIKIPNIIDSSKYYLPSDISYNLKEKLKIPIDSKIILTVSRPDWKKKVDLLIEAVQRMDNVYLVYVGEEKSIIVDKWKSLAKDLNIGDRFKCTGKLSGNDLLSAYATSDIFALASVNENFGMVVIEAMLCGLPVIISEEVGAGEYLNDNEFTKIVKLESSELEYGIKEMLSKEFDKEEIVNSVKNLFSTKRIANEIINNYKNFLENLQ